MAIRYANQLSLVGYNARDIFFVMSGFFITQLLLRERAKAILSLPLFASSAIYLARGMYSTCRYCSIWDPTTLRPQGTDP